jgi:hypothetical protein
MEFVLSILGWAFVAVFVVCVIYTIAHTRGGEWVMEQYGAKLYLGQVIAKKLELQGVGSSDGSDGVTIVAPEPDETLPSGGAEGD